MLRDSPCREASKENVDVLAVDAVTEDSNRSVPYKLDGRVDGTLCLSAVDERDEVHGVAVGSSKRLPEVAGRFSRVDL